MRCTGKTESYRGVCASNLILRGINSKTSMCIRGVALEYFKG